MNLWMTQNGLTENENIRQIIYKPYTARNRGASNGATKVSCLEDWKLPETRVVLECKTATHRINDEKN